MSTHFLFTLSTLCVDISLCLDLLEPSATLFVWLFIRFSKKSAYPVSRQRSGHSWCAHPLPPLPAKPLIHLSLLSHSGVCGTTNTALILSLSRQGQIKTTKVIEARHDEMYGGNGFIVPEGWYNLHLVHGAELSASLSQVEDEDDAF